MALQEVISREEWGARSPKNTRVLNDTTSPTLHHNGPPTGLTKDSSQAEEVEYLKGVQRYHMVTKGWSDIAYSFAVAQSGRVYELRGWKVRTAANGTNRGNSSSHAFLLMIGEGEDPTQELIDSVRRLRHDGDSKYVKGHRDWKATACPGEKVYALIQAGAFEGLPEDKATVKVKIVIDDAAARRALAELQTAVGNIQKAIDDLKVKE